MHMHIYEIGGFCVFLACVFDQHFLDSFRRCVIASASVNSENTEHSVFGEERVNNQSHYSLDIEFQSELCDTQSLFTDPIGMKK